MHESDTSDTGEWEQPTAQLQANTCAHTWAATPTGDDEFLYTCLDCGATKTERS